MFSTLLQDRRTAVMGIINVTPDSFSDGGKFLRPEDVLTQAARMVREGADILDIGGESTRPFSDAVSEREEIQRVLPAIEAIRTQFSIPISIDTTKASVARQAMAAGADIINDISALTFDTDMVKVARDASCPLVIMHMQGNPKNMQVAPSYKDVVGETFSFLKHRVAWLREQGITNTIVIDPGIGFGKTVDHNLSLLKHIDRFRTLGCPILIGHSRKSFLGKLLDLQIDERDEATAILSALCTAAGASLLRVHDVGRTVKAVRLTRALLAAS